VETAHHPKVLGSHPTPATIERVKAQVISDRAFVVRSGFHRDAVVFFRVFCRVFSDVAWR
jgi:hypothetical protein